MSSVTKEKVIEALKGVEDPELFLDVWFLGLIYEIKIDAKDDGAALVDIEMTFTTPMCPSGPEIVNAVKESVEEIENVETASINVVFDPPWKPNEEVQAMMGLL